MDRILNARKGASAGRLERFMAGVVRVGCLQRVIEDTNKPYETRLNSAKKYADAQRSRKSNLKQEVCLDSLVRIWKFLAMRAAP